MPAHSDNRLLGSFPITVFLEELVYRAKINKPSNDWKTSEWDRMVDLVAEAMREPPRDRKEPR